MLGRRRRRRNDRLVAIWERALALGCNSPAHQGPFGMTCCLGQVISHRQRARTGTKAYVRWLVDDSVTAAWFEASRPAVRAYVLATGRYGHGPHHSEAVFYVGPTTFEVIPADALAAYTRRQRRVARQKRRLARRMNRRHAHFGRSDSCRVRPKPGDGQSPQAFTQAGGAGAGM